jgi:hypothetical protein
MHPTLASTTAASTRQTNPRGQVILIGSDPINMVWHREAGESPAAHQVQDRQHQQRLIRRHPLTVLRNLQVQQTVQYGIRPNYIIKGESLPRGRAL